jgi:hypothetical protein
MIFLRMPCFYAQKLNDNSPDTFFILQNGISRQPKLSIYTIPPYIGGIAFRGRSTPPLESLIFASGKKQLAYLSAYPDSSARLCPEWFNVVLLDE